MSHAVPNLTTAEWQEYCADAAISSFLSRFAGITIHSSLYSSFWVFHMLVDSYLQRSERLSVLYGTFYMYVHQEFVEDC